MGPEKTGKSHAPAIPSGSLFSHAWSSPLQHAGAQRPVVVTDTEIRRFVKKLLEFAVPEVSVLSYDQLTPQINLQPLGMIQPAPRAQIAGGD